MRPAPRIRRLRLLSAVLLLSCGLAGGVARADEGDTDQGRVYAIQQRSYRMNHEFSLSFAFMPLDAFYKMFAVSGSYVVHFDDLWAWEAVHLSFAKYMSVDTGLKSELSDRWDTLPTDPEEGRIDFILDTNLMLKPLYGKAVVFDDWVIEGETYFLLGLGAEKYETAWFPAANVGVGLRIFLVDTVSMRLEVREYLSFGEGVGSTLMFALGFSYNAFAGDNGPTQPLGSEDKP